MYSLHCPFHKNFLQICEIFLNPCSHRSSSGRERGRGGVGPLAGAAFLHHELEFSIECPCLPQPTMIAKHLKVWDIRLRQTQAPKVRKGNLPGGLMKNVGSLYIKICRNNSMIVFPSSVAVSYARRQIQTVHRSCHDLSTKCQI